MKKDCSKDFTTNLRDIIQTNSVTNSLSFFLLFRRNQKNKNHIFRAICKSRNEKSGNGMRGMMGMRGVRVGMPGIRVILC